MVFGQINTQAQVNIEHITRHAISEIGYDDVDVGMDHKTATVIVAVDRQSQEIAESVHLNKHEE